ncbi:conjugal transfer protein TrbF [Fusobacterium nucleatum YWH7199]|nr:conjugal transfer protein TrbF [Fusobacterium nucleatum YWH7056]MCL4580419.1 conjugal transfer protein TrbF [Fusobacterium nucleatum YWH7199]MCL4583385.1 conjugal transfer protein TrbF [Fusobacterium nucleatum YWH7054]MCL4593267.1 conjugal transfer protein TrbF [Fusobacterium nucleatum YWH7053]
MGNNKKFTNYEKAVEAFENQLLNISKALHTWKILAFICLGIAFLALSGNIYLSTRSTLIPYVIEVDEAGNAKAINPAYQKNYEPKEEFLIYSLKEFVRNFRWISLDPVVQNSLYSKAMNLLTEPMQEKLKEISLEENLSNLIQEKYTRDVQINSAIKVAGTKNTYQIKWREILYSSSGDILLNKILVGIFTISIEQPKTLQELDRNPLGVYIVDFHITTEGS